MTYAPTGGIVAAPTSSLPEAIGGVRNWDYRYCWLRDASLTLDALMLGGYVDEARAFRDWLLRAAAGDPAELQIMYGIDGGRRLTEFELPWLPGYEGSKPVRVGNAASGQFQLDVYGEVLSAIYAGAQAWASRADADALAAVVEALIEVSRETPGSGPTTASGRCAAGGGTSRTRRSWPGWRSTASCGAIDEFGVGGEEGRRMLPHLAALRERIHAEVCERGFNPSVGAFTQSYGSRDARRERARHPARRLSARQRSAREGHGGGDREGLAARRLRAPLRHRARDRRPARHRGRLPRLQLLAGGQLRLRGTH